MLPAMSVTRFAALVLVAALPTRVDAASLELTWDAPQACPTIDSVQREVTRLEGQRATLSALRASVHVRSTPTGWVAELRTDSNGAQGERTLEAADCAQLADAAALVIAMAHCPELAMGAIEPPAPPVPPGAQLAISAFAAGDWGSLLAPTFAAGLDLSLAFGRFEVRALALRSLEQHRLSGPQADSAVAVQAQLGLGVRGCWYALESRVSLGPCVGVDAWLLSGSSSNVSLPSTGTGWWLGGLLGAQGKLRLFERLAVVVAIEVGAAAARPVFVVEGYGQVFRSGEVVGRARAGLEVRLW